MGCREAILVDKSTFDFPIFLLFFNAQFPTFPILSILSFLFSYFFEQPCRWTPCYSRPVIYKYVLAMLFIFLPAPPKKAPDEGASGGTENLSLSEHEGK